MANAKAILAVAQERTRRYADQRKGDHSYKATSFLLSRENLKPTTAKKLVGPYIGPVTILEMAGCNAAKLELPKTMLVHPVFNVSLLKPYMEAADNSGLVPDPALPPQVTADSANRSYRSWSTGAHARQAERSCGTTASSGSATPQARTRGNPPCARTVLVTHRRLRCALPPRPGA